MGESRAGKCAALIGLIGHLLPVVGIFFGGVFAGIRDLGTLATFLFIGIGYLAGYTFAQSLADTYDMYVGDTADKDSYNNEKEDV